MVLIAAWLTLGAASVPSSADVAVPGGTCQAVKDGIEALKTVTDGRAPEELVAAGSDQLRIVVARLTELADEPGQQVECQKVLTQWQSDRTAWAFRLAAAYSSTTDKSRQKEYASWINVLAPVVPETPGICQAVKELLDSGHLVRAQALLDDIATTGSEEAKKCAADYQDELNLQRAGQQDPIAATGRLSDSAMSGIVNAIAWFIGAFILGLLVLRAGFSMWGTRNTKSALRARTYVNGTVYLLLAVSLGLLLVQLSANGTWTYTLLGIAFLIGVRAGVMFDSRNRLKIDTFVGSDEIKVLVGFDAAVTAELAAIGTRGPRGVDVAVGPDTSTAVADSVALLPGGLFLKAVVSIWSAISPTTDWLLQGAVVAEEPDEIRVAVSLRRGRRVVASGILTSRTFTPERVGGAEPVPPEWADVITAVASWTFWQLQDGNTDPRLYGAGRWESIALQTAAARARERGADDLALGLLYKAAAFDSANLAVLFSMLSINLRHIELRTVDQGRTHRRVVEDLMTLRKRVESLPQPSSGRPMPELPLLWRLDYAISAALMNHIVFKSCYSTTASMPVSDGRDWTQWLASGTGNTEGFLQRLCLDRSDLDPMDRPLYKQISSLAKTALTTNLAFFAVPGPGELAKIDRSALSPREAFNAACTRLVTPADPPNFADGQVPTPKIALGDDLTGVSHLIDRFCGSPSLVERAATLDPFFKRLREGGRAADFLALLGHQLAVKPDDPMMLVALRVVAARLPQRPSTIPEVEAGLRTVTWSAGLDPAERRRLIAAVRLKKAGISFQGVNLLDAAGVTHTELLTIPISDLQTRAAAAAASVGVATPSTAVLRDWQRLVQVSPP